jgi:hypothetical protein
MTSAECSSRIALRVRSSGSPGPAPTSTTSPIAGRSLVSARISAASRSIAASCSSSCAWEMKVTSTNFSQNRRRPALVGKIS